VSEGGPFIAYGEDDEIGVAQFLRRCPTCSRIVKADVTLTVRGDGQVVEPNATCGRCGRVAMPFQGYQ
jgi:ribosomal protein S27AE